MLRPVWLLAVGLVIAGYVEMGGAQTTALSEIAFSGNIHHALPQGNGSTVISSDDRIVVFSMEGGEVNDTSLSDNLDGVGIDGYQQADACGAELFSVDVFASINGQTVTPADVFMADGSLLFDARSLGVPAHVNIDALTRDPDNCDLIFSVDGFIELAGSVLNGGDLVRWNSTTGFSPFSAALSDFPVNAVYLLDNRNLLVSFAEQVTVLGVIAQANDVLEFTPANSTELAFNPVVLDTSWQSVSLDALSAVAVVLPTPGQLVWSVSTTEVFENAGSVSLTVNRINGSDTAATVTYATVADTASSGSDFIAENGSIVFNDGQITRNIIITLQDDPDVEGNEVFFVDLTGVPSGTAGIGNPSRVQVLLRDDEDFLFADGFE